MELQNTAYISCSKASNPSPITSWLPRGCAVGPKGGLSAM